MRHLIGIVMVLAAVLLLVSSIRRSAESRVSPL